MPRDSGGSGRALHPPHGHPGGHHRAEVAQGSATCGGTADKSSLTPALPRRRPCSAGPEAAGGRCLQGQVPGGPEQGSPQGSPPCELTPALRLF